MNERYGIQHKKIRLEELQQYFEKLKKDYKDVSKQRDYTTNAQEINDLERRLEKIYEDLFETDLKINTLQEEIQELEEAELNANLPHALQTLVDILKAIGFETVAKNYRICLSQGRSRWVPDTLEALVRQLEDIPGQPGEAEPLLRFLRLLLQEPALTEQHRESLRSWAEKQGIIELDKKSEIPEQLEACLMIKVQPRAVNSSSLGYIVEAAIAHDPDPWNYDVEPLTTPLSITVTPNPKFAPGYSQEQLPHVLDALIATCGRDYHIPLTELVIHWFLPIELMSLPTEHWQFQSGKHQKEYSGKRCKAVIVRSSDRHFLPHYQAATGDWRRYWKRLLNCHGSKCSEVLIQLNPNTVRTTNWRDDRIVGCKFVEHPDPQQQEMLWDELLSQGVPIALWTRQAGAQGRTPSLSACTIAELPETLANHRQKALSKDSEAARLKAASLCLLLDNPYRPFPTSTSDYESH